MTIIVDIVIALLGLTCVDLVRRVLQLAVQHSVVLCGWRHANTTRIEVHNLEDVPLDCPLQLEVSIGTAEGRFDEQYPRLETSFESNQMRVERANDGRQFVVRDDELRAFSSWVVLCRTDGKEGMVTATLRPDPVDKGKHAPWVPPLETLSIAVTDDVVSDRQGSGIRLDAMARHATLAAISLYILVVLASVRNGAAGEPWITDGVIFMLLVLFCLGAAVIARRSHPVSAVGWIPALQEAAAKDVRNAL
jgi:hypothetical protein